MPPPPCSCSTTCRQVRAAEILGIARNSLRKKIRNLGLTIGRVVEYEDAEPRPAGDDG